MCVSNVLNINYFLRGYCEPQLFFSLCLEAINPIFVFSHRLNIWVILSCRKWLFLPFLSTLIWALFSDEERRTVAAVTGMRWVTLTGWFHLVSSDFHQREAQSQPLSCLTASGHAEKGYRSSTELSSTDNVQTHDDRSQFQPSENNEGCC